MIFLVGIVTFLIAFFMMMTSSLVDHHILLNSIRAGVLSLFSMLVYKIIKHI
jgi:hypothetical protein